MKNKEDARTISPLRRLLMASDLDSLLAFLHQTNTRFTLRRGENGHYDMTIFRDGMLRYEAASGKSARSAVADSLAKFLSGEQRDFHEYFIKDVVEKL